MPGAGGAVGHVGIMLFVLIAVCGWKSRNLLFREQVNVRRESLSATVSGEVVVECG